METPRKRDYMIGARSHDTKRNVFALQKKIGMLTTEIEQSPGHVELQPSIGPAFQEISRIRVFCHLFEHFRATGEVDGTAIVGIGKTKIPYIGAPVEVGNAGSRDFEHELRQGRKRAEVGDLSLELSKVFEKLFVCIQ